MGKKQAQRGQIEDSRTCAAPASAVCHPLEMEWRGDGGPPPLITDREGLFVTLLAIFLEAKNPPVLIQQPKGTVS